MAEPVIITWNPSNWLTIGLMVLIPYFLLGAAVKVYEERQKAA